MKCDQTAMTAVIEKTLSVSGIEPFTVEIRVRTVNRPEPTLTIKPHGVTLAYAFQREDWALTGAGVSGVHTAKVPYRGQPALVRFVVGVHEDMPPWLLSLAGLYRPVNPPG